MRHSSRHDSSRGGLSVGISLLMLLLSVAVPVLERGSVLDRPVVEREHTPGDCPSSHDHTVCTQVGANLSLAAADTKSPIRSAAVYASPIAAMRVVASSPVDGTTRSRAPPLG